MLQLFYIVWGVLCFYSFYFLFFRRWADLISEEDSGQQTLVDPRTSRQLKAPSPFSLLLFGTKLFTFDSPKEEKHWEISPALVLLPDFPSTTPSSPHQGENSSHHGAVATTERWTVSAWMQICGCAGSWEMQTWADMQKRKKSKCSVFVLLKLFCWGLMLLWEIVLLNNSQWDEDMCHVLQVASLDSYLVNIS